jgi:hypothetical protein
VPPGATGTAGGWVPLLRGGLPVYAIGPRFIRPCSIPPHSIRLHSVRLHSVRLHSVRLHSVRLREIRGPGSGRPKLWKLLRIAENLLRSEIPRNCFALVK